jgi:hypothetical protein
LCDQTTLANKKHYYEHHLSIEIRDARSFYYPCSIFHVYRTQDASPSPPTTILIKMAFWFYVRGVSPSILNSISMGFFSKTIGMIVWMNPLMFTVMLVFFWIQMKGYIAFAISEKYFRDALLSSTASLGYSIEETMSRITIKETGQAIQVSIQGWTGTAQIKPVGKGSSDLVKQLAEGMNTYFRATPGAMNYVISYFYLIMGCFMVAMSIWMFTLKIK